MALLWELKIIYIKNLALIGIERVALRSWLRMLQSGSVHGTFHIHLLVPGTVACETGIALTISSL